MHEQYPKRACENLGVSSEPQQLDSSGKPMLPQSDYPFDEDDDFYDGDVEGFINDF